MTDIDPFDPPETIIHVLDSGVTNSFEIISTRLVHDILWRIVRRVGGGGEGEAIWVPIAAQGKDGVLRPLYEA